MMDQNMGIRLEIVYYFQERVSDILERLMN